MAEEKPAAADPADAAPAGPKLIMGMPLLVFVFFVVNILVMAGALAYIVHVSLLYKKPAITEDQVQSEITKAEQKKALNLGEEFITVDYNEMTITLRSEQGGKPHYATVETTLVCGSPECEFQVKDNKAKVEDAIQTALSSRSYTELSSLETKFRVKHEILGKVNAMLKDTAAVDLLFRSFLIQ